ncbi:hypothetical protein ACKRZS_002022 [Fusarium odoratissimum]|uniref:Uncharacterized protein n=2 Tax=Fusarium oxysporum species complex TaxID=171631 RepID=X0J854_FUSO5|nr:uncharacterized protein FOIG_10432 [Fusarium odoratissimum NRRL 54006]EXL97393.1 hypothetical protein FOIG_10432 [Fusarium odoratissimum NRRL 54006]KAK2123544.1 hypothetical protein NOF04DRAFT_7361 [Fusarium oxysporum II5]TXB95540.1 hypothetical protein FocTR4_00015980 [Fusarium oxysporum f. sp. cubense]
MKLSIESIATLAATSQVTAWYVTFYDNTERCEVDGETEYQILEGEQSDCNTFAASIDGVDCIHFVEGGRNREAARACSKLNRQSRSSTQTLIAQSIPMRIADS